MECSGCHSVQVVAKEQFCGLGSLLLFYMGSGGLNSGLQEFRASAFARSDMPLALTSYLFHLLLPKFSSIVLRYTLMHVRAHTHTLKHAHTKKRQTGKQVFTHGLVF